MTYIGLLYVDMEHKEMIVYYLWKIKNQNKIWRDLVYEYGPEKSIATTVILWRALKTWTKST